MLVNPIVLEDSEIACHFVGPPDPGTPSRAGDPRHEIDELHNALRVQKHNYRVLFRKRDEAVRLCKDLLDAKERWWREETPERQHERQVPECPICREAACCGVIKCGHQFCEPCFHLWYQEQGAKRVAHSCPTCRANLNNLTGKPFIKVHRT